MVTELSKLLHDWINTGDDRIIKKIIKQYSAKALYKKCKEMYKNTNSYLYILCMKKINFFYYLKSFTYSKKKSQISSEKNLKEIRKIAKELDELLHLKVNPQKAVYIMQFSFFDSDGKNYISGGAERYVCDLAQLIINAGYTPVLIQCGNYLNEGFWIKEFSNLIVIGVNTTGENYLQIVNRIKSPKLTIYSGCIEWDTINPHFLSILISHGITWDSPQYDADIFALKQFINLSNTFVSVDTNTISWFRSTYSKSIAIEGKKMVYIPNYVDLNLYKPTNNQNKNLKIIFPRRCSPERGFELMANVIPKILDMFKHVEFDFIGYAHTPEIKAIIQNLKHQYPQRVNHYVCKADDMVKVYQQADISVIPTLYSEGTSLSCIEAMACGNAVIATDVGGLPNLIINNYNGLLISPDENSLEDAIIKLVEDKELRNKLQKNAVEVAQVFSKSEWNYKWENILNSFLSENTIPNKKNIINKDLQQAYITGIESNLTDSTHNNLFITTGFISTINAMSIIEQKNLKNENNILIVYSSYISDISKEYNQKLLLNEYFKQIFYADNFSKDENIKFIEDKDFLNKFDAIYTTAQPAYQIYDKHNNINLFEEGISSYFPYECIDYNNVSKIYLSNYSNKISYYDKQYIDKVEPLDKNILKDIIKRIQVKNNMDFTYLYKDNQILLLSQYIYNDFMDLDKVVHFYATHIDKLLSNGYNVLFKSHPRVDDTVLPKLEEYYKNNEKFNVIPKDIKYPIELMVSQINPKFTVTTVSGGAFSCEHIYGIKCYGFGSKLAQQHPLENIKRNANVFLENLPHVSELYDNSISERINA